MQIETIERKKTGVNRLEDPSGDCVFYKDDAGEIFRTYSTFGRGGEQFLGIYGYLDVMPKGRNENGPYHSLTDWARPRNKYGRAATSKRMADTTCRAADVPRTNRNLKCSQMSTS